MQRLLEKTNQNRDALLEFLLIRLGEIRRLQLQEIDHVSKRDQWFISVHKGSDNLPNPNRWHEAAGMYKEAALALCRGHTQRGAHLLKKALENESSARKSLPNAVAKKSTPTPSAPKNINEHQASTINPPNQLKIADQILSSQTAVDPASTRKKRLHQWFGLDDEEKEEEEDNADG